MGDQEVLDRATKAQALLSNEVFIEAFEDVNNAILRQIEECPLRDTEGLIRLKQMLHISKSFRANLEERISAGKLTRLRIEEGKTKRDFLGELWPRQRVNNP